MSTTADPPDPAARERPQSAIYQWDATSLIACACFQVDGRLVLDYLLAIAPIVVTREVQRETVDAGLAGGYPDAVEIQARIQAGRIAVREAPRLSDPFEEVLDLYGLQEGDKAVTRLAVQATDVEATVTDISVASSRFARSPRS